MIKLYNYIIIFQTLKEKKMEPKYDLGNLFLKTYNYDV